jgi:hypothetical protein
MGRISLKVLAGIGLVLIISCCMWFATPHGTYTSNVKWSGIQLGYTAPGNIYIEKRDAETNQRINVAGFSIDVSPNPYGTGTLNVLDNYSPDSDTAGYGLIALLGVPVGTYTISEVTVPPGYNKDALPVTGNVTSGQTLTVVLWDTPTKFGQILIHKVDKLTGLTVEQPGVTFEVSPNPYGPGTLTVTDNDLNDYDPRLGYILLINVPVGTTYTVVEKIPPEGYLVDPTPMPADVLPGQTAEVTSRDLPEILVPGLSDTGIWIMIGSLAGFIFGFMIWRGRRQRSA